MPCSTAGRRAPGLRPATVMSCACTRTWAWWRRPSTPTHWSVSLGTSRSVTRATRRPDRTGSRTPSPSSSSIRSSEASPSPTMATSRTRNCCVTTSSITEVLAELVAHTIGTDIVSVLRRALPRLQGAYCLLFLTKDALVGVRDPLGIRPLCLGRLPDGGAIITSETCALDTVGAEFVREIEPGEAVMLGRGEPVAEPLLPSTRKAMCMFEFIYFARPDSRLQGQSLYEARRNMGRELAREAPAEADIVISLPDSGTPAAVGFAEASGIPYSEGLIKSRYITRTFIQPNQRLRNIGIKLKFNPLREILEGKRVVLVDDSIVRGTTSRKIVEELRRAGTKTVHFRVSSPPIQWPCFMGIDIASRSELIASGRSVEEVERLIGADSLKYLSKAGLFRAVKNVNGFCMACFDGDYPVPVPVQLEMDKMALETVAR